MPTLAELMQNRRQPGVLEQFLSAMIPSAEAADKWTPTNAAGDAKALSGQIAQAPQGQTFYSDQDKAMRLAQRKAKYDALPPAVKATIGPWDPTRM